DSRSRATAQKHSVDLPSRSRRFTNFDTNYFDLIIAMDEDNLTNIQSMMHFPDQLQKVYLMMQFDSESGLKAVPDPYYGGSNGFENVFEMLEKACESLLNFLKPHISK
ncbi:MAG: low molecular weight phosphotyrosine protein phosphatase, partial [Bacteroidetes bacterium]|nr:low molecular weight phosphotyrosine protein phosphatase [Bacteroidota bacterium]